MGLFGNDKLQAQLNAAGAARRARELQEIKLERKLGHGSGLSSSEIRAIGGIPEDNFQIKGSLADITDISQINQVSVPPLPNQTPAALNGAAGSNVLQIGALVVAGYLLYRWLK